MHAHTFTRATGAAIEGQRWTRAAWQVPRGRWTDERKEGRAREKEDERTGRRGSTGCIPGYVWLTPGWLRHFPPFSPAWPLQSVLQSDLADRGCLTGGLLLPPALLAATLSPARIPFILIFRAHVCTCHLLSSSRDKN